MTQAPASTIANAVRQHGGGRHPLNLPCSVPAGRLQDSRGGVINRRAEGATSSNTLPASCAAAAHPTTGVRRARELSPSLRSQNRPHAQLVEGYTYPLSRANFHEALGEITSLDCVLENVISQHAPVRARSSAYINPVKLQSSLKLRPELQYTSSHLLVTQINNIDLFQLKEYRLKPFLCKMLCITSWHVQATRSHLLQLDRLSKGARRKLRHERSINRRPLPSALSCRAGLRVCNHKCSDDSTYGADCTSPSRANLTGIHCQHQHPRRCKDQNNARHRDRQVLPCPLPAALVPHPYNLDDLEHRPSLPASCHHVQRGAAA